MVDPGLADGLDRRSHLLHVVQGVEDAEDVDADLGRLGHERRRDLGRVRRVAHCVAAAEQHLQAEPGHVVAQRGEPLPRVLGDEPQGHVVRRPAPALHTEQLRGHPADVRGDPQQVLGPDPGGQQRLVGIPEGRVGDLGAGPRPQVGGEPLGAELEQPLSRALGRGHGEVHPGRALDPRVEPGRRLAVRLVHCDLGQPAQQLGAAVGRGVGGQQPGPLLDEGGGDVPREEVGILQHGLQERDVCADAADPELGQRPFRPGDRGLEGPATAGQLDQHGVEVGADLYAHVGGAPVQAYACRPRTGTR